MSLTMSMRRPGPSNTQEDALVSFDQALTDWFMFADKVLDLNVPGQSRNAVDYSSFALN
jgi:hypothetical protein